MLLDAPSSTQMAACKNEQCFKSSMNYSRWNDTIKHAFHFLGLYLIWSWIFDTADALVFQAIVWIYRLCSMISIHRPTDSPRDIASTNAVCAFCFSLMIATVFLRSNSEPLQEACSVVCHDPKPGFGWIWRMPFPSFPILSMEFEWIQCFWAYITYRLIVSSYIYQSLEIPICQSQGFPRPRTAVARVMTLVRNRTFVCCWSNLRASKRAWPWRPLSHCRCRRWILRVPEGWSPFFLCNIL